MIGYDLITQPFKLGDFNRDSSVDAADIKAMELALADLPDFEMAKSLSIAQRFSIGDLNHDGKVSIADLQSWLQFLKTGGGSDAAMSKPPSATIALCLAAVCPVFQRWPRAALRALRFAVGTWA
ncbi:MAG TPA: dockerin type I domain-containing protein [Pirellulales bacterium]|nr:dockerin type I domain-containing protein [Pirellulales bacterium]